MRVRALALIIAAAAGALIFLAVTRTASTGSTPQDAVHHALEPSNPTDMCAQYLRPTFYPCNHEVVSPAAARFSPGNLVISHVVVRGTHATLQANYGYASNPVEEHYRLVQRHGVWLIAGTFFPSR